MAAAGPAITLVICAVFSLAGWLLPLPSAVDGVVSWIGLANAFLLAFNLIPAYPLDGGRILHSLLWWRRDRGVATRVAAGIGRGLGMIMIGLGLFGSSRWGFGFLWLSVMGLFLLMAATGESRTEQVRELLDGLTVADVIERDPVCVLPTLSLSSSSTPSPGRSATPHIRSSTATAWSACCRSGTSPPSPVTAGRPPTSRT